MLYSPKLNRQQLESLCNYWLEQYFCVQGDCWILVIVGLVTSSSCILWEEEWGERSLAEIKGSELSASSEGGNYKGADVCCVDVEDLGTLKSQRKGAEQWERLWHGATGDFNRSNKIIQTKAEGKRKGERKAGREGAVEGRGRRVCSYTHHPLPSQQWDLLSLCLSQARTHTRTTEKLEQSLLSLTG